MDWLAATFLMTGKSFYPIMPSQKLRYRMLWESPVDNKDYSFFNLMEKIYEAKAAYYGSGKSLMTDREYDALEGSIIAIHGQERFKEWYSVGYDEKRHQEVAKRASELREEFKEWWNNGRHKKN